MQAPSPHCILPGSCRWKPPGGLGPGNACRLRGPAFLHGFVDETVAHLTQGFDLGLHDIAGSQKRVGTLTDAAAGTATEHVACLEGEHVRGVLDLLLGVKMNCEVLPFCLTAPLTVRRIERFM